MKTLFKSYLTFVALILAPVTHAFAEEPTVHGKTELVAQQSFQAAGIAIKSGNVIAIEGYDPSERGLFYFYATKEAGIEVHAGDRFSVISAEYFPTTPGLDGEAWMFQLQRASDGQIFRMSDHGASPSDLTGVLE